MATLPELTLQLVLFRFGALLVIAAVQGGLVAATAVLLGDPGPRHDGRLTANPFAHLDLLGGIGAVLFGFSWSRPVLVDARLFRTGRIGILVPIAAAFAGLLLAALALRLAIVPALTLLPYAAGLATAAFLRIAAALCLAAAALSLLPVPPLTAGLILSAAGLRLPKQAVWVPGLIVLAAAAAGLLRGALAPLTAALAALIAP